MPTAIDMACKLFTVVCMGDCGFVNQNSFIARLGRGARLRFVRGRPEGVGCLADGVGTAQPIIRTFYFGRGKTGRRRCGVTCGASYIETGESGARFIIPAAMSADGWTGLAASHSQLAQRRSVAVQRHLVFAESSEGRNGSRYGCPARPGWFQCSRISIRDGAVRLGLDNRPKGPAVTSMLVAAAQ